MRVNLRIASKQAEKDGTDIAGLIEMAFENERVAGAAGAGKGTALVKLGRLEPALATLKEAALALEGVQDRGPGEGYRDAEEVKATTKATQADKKHLWTCLESLSRAIPALSVGRTLCEPLTRL